MTEIDGIKKATSEIERNRALGKDQITPQLIKYEGEILIKKLKILLNKCLDDRNYHNFGKKQL